MTTREELLGEVRAVVERRPEILDAYVFGSVARGDSRSHSDIDVAVFIDEAAFPRASAFGYDADLSAELMRRLATNAIDVVILNKASPLLYHRVVRDGERVLSRDLAQTTVATTFPDRTSSTTRQKPTRGARWSTATAASGSLPDCRRRSRAPISLEAQTLSAY